MTNYYATELLVAEHQDELRHEAERERLGRLSRQHRSGSGRPSARVGRRRWWERLMLFRSPATRPATVTGPARTATSPRDGRRATVVAGDSC